MALAKEFSITELGSSRGFTLDLTEMWVIIYTLRVLNANTPGGFPEHAEIAWDIQKKLSALCRLVPCS